MNELNTLENYSCFNSSSFYLFLTNKQPPPKTTSYINNPPLSSMSDRSGKNPGPGLTAFIPDLLGQHYLDLELLPLYILGCPHL